MAEQKASTKVKKKTWFALIAPKIFNEQQIGETVASEPKSVVGRTFLQNLMSLTNDIKKQNVNVKFEVEKVESTRAMTRIVGYEIMPSSIKRMVRRNNIKMDMSFAAKTADNKSVRMKPLLLTRTDTKRSIGTKIRKLAQEHIIKYVQKAPFEEVMNDLIMHKLQSSLRESLKKIYPLRICEIRYAGIEKTAHQAEKKE